MYVPQIHDTPSMLASSLLVIDPRSLFQLLLSILVGLSDCRLPFGKNLVLL